VEGAGACAGAVDCAVTGAASGAAAGAGELPAADAKGSLNEGASWAGKGGCPLSAVTLMGGTWMLSGGTLWARSINAIPAAAISTSAAAASVHPATRRVRPKVEREMAGAGFKVRHTVVFTRGSVNGEGRITNCKLLMSDC